jgi:L-asparaginase
MIKIFATGGTIDKVYFDANSEFQVGDPGVIELLKEANTTLDISVDSLMRKDSLEMTDDDRQQVREAVLNCEAKRILITHGTDTMVDTGKALDGIPDKTIVFTGAMQPARIKHSDAEFNVGFALAAVQLLPPGIYIAMNGQVFDPAHVHKNRKQLRFEAD